MIGNHSIGSYPAGSSPAYDTFIKADNEAPDLVATRSGSAVALDVLNFNGRTAKVFRSADIRGLFTPLVEITAAHNDTGLAPELNYKYKAQFVKDYEIGAVTIQVKSPVCSPRYSVSEARKL